MLKPITDRIINSLKLTPESTEAIHDASKPPTQQRIPGVDYDEVGSYAAEELRRHREKLLSDTAEKKKSENRNSTRSAVMANLYGEQWGLALFLSFLFTWGVGLVPPLLIRFAILCRPIGKGWAIGVVALFWVFNIVLFTALGSQSKSHVALALVALASYAILRKGAKKQVMPAEAE
ncbi:MAG TPA: hypothetical protein ENN95_02405 [Deltaproteobacteria bacterium]|nr:hypothetical protein [Deltaproteobacteria bacterium]